MPLDLRMQKKLDGYGWVIMRKRHRIATSGRYYPTFRAMRLSLIGFLKSIQADNFLVYDETEDVSLRTARKRKAKGVQASDLKAPRRAA